MAVKIKLKRMGKIRTPQYRIVVADARTKRDGRAIEEIGLYHPQEEPSYIQVNSERVQHWLSVGAQPTDPVRHLLKLTGDWQQHKGLPAPPPLKVAEPKPDRDAEFQAVLKELVLPDNEDKSQQSDKAAASEKKPRSGEDKSRSGEDSSTDSAKDSADSTKSAEGEA